jgi:hypothetical protein
MVFRSPILDTTPQELPSAGVIIAPFWMDPNSVDSVIYYRFSGDSNLLGDVGLLVNAESRFFPDSSLIVTWRMSQSNESLCPVSANY